MKTIKLSHYILIVLSLVLLIVFLNFSCSSIPEKDLHACFYTMTEKSLIKSSAGDSARVEKCFWFARRDIIFNLCNVKQDKTGNFKINSKNNLCKLKYILNYIETKSTISN